MFYLITQLLLTTLTCYSQEGDGTTNSYRIGKDFSRSFSVSNNLYRINQRWEGALFLSTHSTHVETCKDPGWPCLTYSAGILSNYYGFYTDYGIGYQSIPDKVYQDNLGGVSDVNEKSGISPTYFVSPMGSDSNEGTEDKPFRTIEKARDMVQMISKDMENNLVVYLRGGIYDIDTTIVFHEANSGQNGFNIIYKAYEGEEPVINGGKKVTGWIPVVGTELWKAKIDFTDQFRNLYVNGRRVGRAVSDKSYVGVAPHLDSLGEPDGIIVDQSVIGDYRNKEDIELHWSPEWRDFQLLVKDIVPGKSGQKIILMKQPYYSTALKLKNECLPTFDKAFYIENAIELLDTHGEWYFDRSTHELFYYPEIEDMTTAEVYVPVLERFLEIRGEPGKKVHNLDFQGITFRYSTWLEPSEKGFSSLQAECICPGELNAEGNPVRELVLPGILLDYAEQVRFEDNVFEHMGASCIGLLNGINGISITGNYFQDISDAAIVAGHWNHQNNEDDIFKNSQIRNNLIQNTGVEYLGAPAISVLYAQNVDISHNDIAETPYIGISIGWGWSHTIGAAGNNRINNNRIERCFVKTKDGGGIYTLGAMPGTEVVGNYIRYSFWNGIQNDKGSGGIIFRNNVLEFPQYHWRHVNSVGLLEYDNTYTTMDFTALHKKNDTPPIVPEPFIEKNTSVIPDAEWPQEAMKIIREAGLEGNYRELLQHLMPDRYSTMADETFNVSESILRTENNTAGYLMPSWSASESMTAKVTLVDLTKVEPKNNFSEKCLKFVDMDSCGNASVKKRFASQKEMVMAEWTFMEMSGTMNGYFLTGKGGNAIELYSSAGELVYRDSLLGFQKIQQLETGKWYSVKLIVSPVMGKFDLYVNHDLKLPGVQFTNPSDEIDGILFGTDHDCKDAIVYIDNVKIWSRGADNRKVQAAYPEPGDGQLCFNDSLVLYWLPGFLSNSSDVYFGISMEAVLNAHHASSSYKGSLPGNDYYPGILVTGQTYYWRIDAVGQDSTFKGSIWSFTMTEDTTPKIYSVKLIFLDRSTGTPVYRAFFTHDDDLSLTNHDGEIVLEYLFPDTLYFTVEHTDYFTETESIVINGDTSLVIPLTAKYADLFFEVTDNADPLEDVKVTLNGSSLSTNEMGSTMFFNRKARRTYGYTVEKEGYPSFSDSVYLEIDTTLHINLRPVSSFFTNGLIIQVYPNPAKDYLYLDAGKMNAKIDLTNLTGYTVMTGILYPNNNWMDLSGLSPGVYFIKIQAGEEIHFRKIIKL